MGQKLALCIVLGLAAGCDSSKACAPGKSGCACLQQVCDTGSACVAGTCRDEARISLSIGDGNARACEVLLGETGGKLSRVVFAGDVKGKWLRQGDKLAAAFHATGDTAVGRVEVGYAGGSAQASFDVVASHCYGADGVELPGAKVSR